MAPDAGSDSGRRSPGSSSPPRPTHLSQLDFPLWGPMTTPRSSILGISIANFILASATYLRRRGCVVGLLSADLGHRSIGRGGQRVFYLASSAGSGKKRRQEHNIFDRRKQVQNAQ
mmetsp:Transcript_62839/g.185587  ORF Transcript_62839/g.185587 Transcript_62839/m.185587 type:complete len:116 (+) Transcript_62839:1172-1519(+)